MQGIEVETSILDLHPLEVASRLPTSIDNELAELGVLAQSSSPGDFDARQLRYSWSKRADYDLQKY